MKNRGTDDDTPMMKQYRKIKAEYNDCILFFRLGDFYEMFYEDATEASEILEITLTGKNCGKGERAPMCGVPYHSAAGYIAKLIKHGKKVAVCEQVEEPKKGVKVVKREVIRVITPGTANLDAVLVSDENNFLASVYMTDKEYAASFCDVSTGDLYTTQGPNDVVENQLENTLACFKPSEIIINDGAARYNRRITALRERFDFCESYVSEDMYDYDSARDAVYKKFDYLKGNDFLSDKKLCVRSLGAMLEYLRETQKTDLSHIRRIRPYDVCDFMEIDLSSRRNLELTETMRDKSKRGSLLGILDMTKTGMGARRLKSWIDRPLVDVNSINLRLDAVAELAGNPDMCFSLRDEFKRISDIERIISRVVYGTCNARDLLSLRQSLEVLPTVKALLAKCKCTFLKKLYAELDIMEDICGLITSAIRDPEDGEKEKPLPITVREGGMIRDGFDKELDRLRSIMNNGSGILVEMENREKEKTDIKNLKISYNKVFGYYIEVSKGQLDKVPDTYIRKQTLTNGERYITQELKELENTVLSAKERANDLEYEDFMYLRSEINKSTARLQDTAKIVSTADVLCSFAEVSSQNGYARPTVNDGDKIIIKGGRHPIVETVINDSLFVPNDTYLDTDDSMFALITGPNMAGKSTYMRQTALITLMSQIGCFVPADECCIGVVDRIFTRIGASDDLASGQSTFMVEMNEVAHILKNSTKKSLLVLDEIGRGTSTFDGLSIAWAVVEYICEKIGAKTLFATHYHELTALEGKIPGVKNYSVAVKRRGEDITFLRKIVRGGTDDSFGIEVARLAGVPDEVTARAREVLVAVEGGNAPDGEQIRMNIVNNDEIKNCERDVADAVMSIDISTITPLEALNELYQLQKKVGEMIEN